MPILALPYKIKHSYLDLILFIISFSLCTICVYLLVKTLQSNRENAEWIARELEDNDEKQ